MDDRGTEDAGGSAWESNPTAYRGLEGTPLETVHAATYEGIDYCLVATSEVSPADPEAGIPAPEIEIHAVDLESVTFHLADGNPLTLVRRDVQPRIWLTLAASIVDLVTEDDVAREIERGAVTSVRPADGPSVAGRS